MQLVVAPEIAPVIAGHPQVLSGQVESAPAKPRTLVQAVIDEIRLRHYSRSTEQSYVGWTRRFIRWAGRRHPRDMGAAEVEGFLTHLAVEGHVSEPTQRQALSALLFPNLRQIRATERV